MAKTELKGKIITVSEIEMVGEKNTPKQTVIFMVPPFTNGFGETIGNEQLWQLTIIGKTVEKLKFAAYTHEFMMGTATVYLESREVKAKETGDPMYIISANLGEWLPKN
jgi:hypothetical protein